MDPMHEPHGLKFVGAAGIACIVEKCSTKPGDNVDL